VSDPTAGAPDCELCREDGGAVLWRDAFCRVVLAGDPDYPAFCRVILARHVREMTDLDAAERARLMTVVFGVEAALRECVRPEKMNLASFGNVVPHLHWHVIPRFRDDRHFPSPIWAAARRERGRPAPADHARLAAAIASKL
jgi:diadenosine tetraphosphate (Ap4A) HIT family hydrolase